MLRSWPVQQAIYAALVADAPLMALITAVKDQPDQNQPMPYISLGENTSAPDDAVIETGAQETLTLHVWDKSAGMSKVKQILDRMWQVLHNAKLTVSGTQFCDCRCEFAETLREPDGQTRHGVLRVRVVTFG